jgi:CRISPR/Cas system-associated exonuclease Cas4 (RecB family)|tara:strand:+ start:639 stop:854 length:216 start_codon:yes stop_codon:yes gene_type:complete
MTTKKTDAEKLKKQFTEAEADEERLLAEIRKLKKQAEHITTVQIPRTEKKHREAMSKAIEAKTKLNILELN